MSHEFDSGMFTTQKAWHGLGNVLDAAPRTTAEAITAAGMNWQVLEQPLLTCSDAEALETLEDWKVLKRSDNGTVLHVCPKTWTPVQNAEAFNFFDPIIQDGDVTIDAAVSLREGKRIAITAKVKDGIGEVLPGDEVEQYLVLYNAHDGSLSLGIMFSSIRVVCANTLNWAISDRKRKGGYAKFAQGDDVALTKKMVRLRHTKNIHSNLNIARDAINISRRQFDLTLEQYRTMAKTPMNTELFRQYLTNIFAPDLGAGTKNERSVTQWRNYEQLEENFESGVGMDIKGVQGTVWAGYQAVTEFVTHQRGSGKDEIEAARNRLNQTWFGTGSKIIETAHREALAMV
ncbi:MAG: DUF932 domain-containing protein [Spirulina sp. SIO3F2]|nr:DUF932 domain-containing protein [Spirulina sp. SIO3F2]